MRPYDHTLFDVWVPADPDGPHEIHAGSGIVGTRHGDDVLLDFEGDRPSDVVTFADRVRIAAGRHHTQYPTIARDKLPADSLVHVGTFDPVNGEVRLLDDGGAVAALHGWSDAIATDVGELFTTDPAHRARRAAIGRIHNTDPGTIPMVPPEELRLR